MTDVNLESQKDEVSAETNGTLHYYSSTTDTSTSPTPEVDYEALNPTAVLILKKLKENINAGPFLEPVIFHRLKYRWMSYWFHAIIL